MRIEYLFMAIGVIGFSVCAALENLTAWIRSKKGGKCDGRHWTYRAGSL